MNQSTLNLVAPSLRLNMRNSREGNLHAISEVISSRDGNNNKKVQFSQRQALMEKRNTEFEPYGGTESRLQYDRISQLNQHR